MNVSEAKILKTMVTTYQDESDDVLDDYNLIGAVLCLLKAHGAPEDGETVRRLCRRQNKIADKMKGIQENIDKAQEELKAFKEDEK